MADALDSLVDSFRSASAPPASAPSLDDLVSSFKSQPQQSNTPPPVRPGSPQFMGPVRLPVPQLQAEETPAPTLPPPVMGVYRQQQPGGTTYQGPQGKVVDTSRVAGPRNEPLEAAKDLRDLLLGPAYGTPLKADSDVERALNGLLRLTAGLNAPETIATVVGTAGIASALPALANTPKFVAALASHPGLAKGLDIASRAAVPAAFGAPMFVRSGLELGQAIKEGDIEKGTEAAGGLLLGGGLLGHVGTTAGETLAEYPRTTPPAQTSRVGGPTLGAESATGLSEQAAQSQQRAETLQSAGRNLPAQEWLKQAETARGGLPPLGLVIDGENYVVRYGGQGQVELRDSQGKSIFTGTPNQLQDFVRGMAGHPKAPGLPKPTAGGAEPGGETPMPPASGVPPQPEPVPAEHVGTAPPPQPESQPETGNSKTSPLISRGSVHTAPDGTVYRVQGIAGNQVIYQQETPQGKKAGVASIDRFREMAGIPLESGITKAPVLGADVLPNFPAPQLPAGVRIPPGGAVYTRTPGIVPPSIPAAATPPELRPGMAGPQSVPVQPQSGVTSQTQKPEPQPAPYSQFVRVGNKILDAAGQQIATMSEVAGEPVVHLEGEHAKLSGPERADLVEEIEQAPEQKHEFSSTQVNLPGGTRGLAGDVRNFAASIPEKHLAGDGREAEPHITLKYGLHGVDPGPIRELLANEAPITATLGKTSIFPASESGGADVLKVDVDSPDLHRLNAKLAEALPHTDTYPIYQPHVTLAYLKPGEGQQYAGQDVPNVTGQQITLDHVTFSAKNGQSFDIPLGGTTKSPTNLVGGVSSAPAPPRKTLEEGGETGATVPSAEVGPTLQSQEVPTKGGPGEKLPPASGSSAQQSPAAPPALGSSSTAQAPAKPSKQYPVKPDENVQSGEESDQPFGSERGSFSLRPKSPRVSSDQLRRGLNIPYRAEPGAEEKLGGAGYWVKNGKVIDLQPGEIHGQVSIADKNAQLNAGAVRGRGEGLQARADSLDSINFKAGVGRAVEEARRKGLDAVHVEADYSNGRFRFVQVPLADIPELLANPHRYIREQGYGYQSQRGSAPMLVNLPAAIEKLGKEAAERIRAGSDDLLKVFAPAAREGAAPAAMIVRNRAAELARRTAVAEKALEDASKFVMELPEQGRWDWYDRIETDQPELNPALEGIAKLLRTLLNGRRADVQALGTGKLEKFIEHYMPHIYEDPKKAEQTFGEYYSKRPFEGSKAFLKRRKFETLKEGMEAGLKLISDNPIRMVLLKLAEMDKYIMSHRVLNDAKEQGIAKYFPAEEMPPHGWQFIDDKIATVFGPPAIAVKEYYDQAVTDRLNELAASLGIKHERKVAIGGTRAGYAEGAPGMKGGNVVTRFATPESVLAHEIGHQLEWKYNLSGRLKARDYPERTKELRALADLRYEGQEASEHFRKYVRERDEKMANAIAALLYAPDKFKATAPNTWDFLRDELWHIPALRPLFDIKPSMVLGSRTADVPIQGIRILGRYAMPEPAARVVNNYLSPGLREKSALFRGYVNLANAMNQFNLGFSAFHLGFTTADAMVSKFALGIYQAAHGHPLKGLVSAVQFPLAPFTGIVRGDKLLKEYYKPGTQGAEIGGLVDSLVVAGGRGKMDNFYRTNIVENMMQAFRKGGLGYLTGVLRIPFAAAELTAKPILDWIVPRQKLAVFADMAEFELQRAQEQNLSPEELQANLARAWDSVDNRMGQLVYDNLFWNKTVKDMLMASVRSVGWNTGTIREILGGAADIRKLAQFNTDHAVPMQEGPPGEFNAAKKKWNPDVTTRLSYLIALPIVAGILGAVYHYLATGEHPQELKDYYLPRSGPRGSAGWNRRVQMPTYMKDAMAVHGEGVWKTARGKLHPLLTLIADMLANEDYFHKPIRNENDPVVKQAEAYVKHALEAYTPMSIKTPANKRLPKETPGQKLQKEIGITRAPQYLQDGGKAARAANRGQKIPHYGDGGIVTQPTKALVGEKGPEDIVPLKSGQDIIRGSTNIPLSEEGLAQVKELASRLAAKGGFDRILTTDLTRGVQTAQAISEATGVPITRETKELHPWHLGEIEGQPTKQVLDKMNRYVTKKPDAAVPGRGSESTQEGESFNSFKRRLLGFLKEEIARLKKDPEERTALVTHYRDVRTIQAWIRKGAPASLEVDAEHVTKKGNDPPGTIYRLYLGKAGRPLLEPVNLKTNTELKGGLYIIRHGITAWNSEGKNVQTVTKPTVMTLAKDGPVAVVPVRKKAA